jgi:hypothetical protein
VTAQEPSSAGSGVRSCWTCDGAGALLSREVEPGAAGYVEALEPSLARRRGPELLYTWRCQSHPQQGGGVWSCWTRDDTGALLNREVGSRAAGHVAALETSSVGR